MHAQVVYRHGKAVQQVVHGGPQRQDNLVDEAQLQPSTIQRPRQVLHERHHGHTQRLLAAGLRREFFNDAVAPLPCNARGVALARQISTAAAGA